MNTGVVHICDDTTMVVSYRGEDQLLPGGSMTFLTESDLRQAMKIVAEAAGWELDFLEGLPGSKMFEDVKTGIGWSWHPSGREITLFHKNKNIKTYREEIRSHMEK